MRLQFAVAMIAVHAACGLSTYGCFGPKKCGRVSLGLSMAPKARNDTLDEDRLYTDLEHLGLDWRKSFCADYTKTKRTQGADLHSIDKHHAVLKTILTHAPKALPPYGALFAVATRLNAHFHWKLGNSQIRDGADRWKLMLRHVRDVARLQSRCHRRRAIPFPNVRELVAMVQIEDDTEICKAFFRSFTNSVYPLRLSCTLSLSHLKLKILSRRTRATHSLNKQDSQNKARATR